MKINVLGVLLLLTIGVGEAQVPVNQTLSGTTNLTCPQNNTLNLEGSELGFDYYLRNDAVNAIVGNLQTGTGVGLGFQTGVLSQTSAFHVFATNSTNQALAFDGSDDTVEILHDSSLQPADFISVDAWIYPTDITSNINHEIYRKENAGVGRILFSFQDDGTHLSFGVETFDDGYQELDADINSTDFINQWVHVLATYDGNDLKVYQDGVEIGSLPATGSIIQPVSPSAAFIGSSTGVTEYFHGKIASLRIWDKALVTPAEIQQVQEDFFDGSESNIVAYFNFNENAGTTLNDLTSNMNHGDILNGAIWTDGPVGQIGKIISNSQTITKLPVLTETLSGENTITFPQDNTLTLDGSNTCVNYALHNSEHLLVGDRQTGTGISLEFETGIIIESESYHAIASLPSYALDFDGVDDTVGLAPYDGFLPSSDFTIEFWIYLRDVVSDQMIYYQGIDGMGGNVSIYTKTIDYGNFDGHTLTLAISGDSGFVEIPAQIGSSVGGVIQPGSPPFYQDQWIHYSASFDSNAQFVTIKIDDQFSNFGSAMLKTPTFNGPAFLGSNQSTTEFFDGLIASFRIWDKHLIAEDKIQQAMNNNFIAQEPGLRVYYPFYENSGTQLHDISGLNDGIIYNPNNDSDTWVSGVPGGAIDSFSNTQTITYDPQPIMYVDINASGGNNGSDWANAFNHLSDAIAAIGIGGEIQMAEGLYQQAANTIISGYTSVTHYIDKPLTIKGGFPSGGGLQHSSNPTVLDGSGNYPMFYLDDTIYIEGLTIQNTLAANSAIFANAELVLRDARIINNIGTSSSNDGLNATGAVIKGTDITLINTEVSGNQNKGVNGGAIYGNNINLINSTVSNNVLNGRQFFVQQGTAQRYIKYGYGGGIFANGNVSLINSQVHSNTVNVSLTAGDVTTGDLVFIAHGGGIKASGTVFMVNSMVNANLLTPDGFQTFLEGGGIHAGQLDIKNSVLWQNDSGNSNTEDDFNHLSAGLTAENSLITLMNPVGNNNIDATVMDFDPMFINDFRLAVGSILIDAGDNSFLPLDIYDLDQNGEFNEPHPIDLDDKVRISGNSVDIGAYEFQQNYYVSGQLTDLIDGNSLVLQNNNTDELTLTDNGAFAFAMPVDVGAKYAVSIFQAPTDPIQPCTINNSNGTITDHDIIDVVVICEAGNDLIFRDGF